MKTTFVVACYFSICFAISAAAISSKKKDRCLHKGCPLSQGMKVAHINETLKKLLKEDEFESNMIRVVTWNILHDKDDRFQDSWRYRKDDVCEYVMKVQPAVIGFQEVLKKQHTDLKSCLKRYYPAKIKKSHSDDILHNSIFIKQTRILRVVKSGTFWLSETPNIVGSKLPNESQPRTCSWIRAKFAKQLTRGRYFKPEKSGSIQRLFQLLLLHTARNQNQKKKLQFRRPTYKWFEFYIANTHLDYRDVNTASQQIKILLQHMKNKIMNQRRSPIILMGDLNWEDNTAMYDAILNMKWLRNTMVESRETHPALTAVNFDSVQGKELIDYIWQSGFTPVMSSTMMDVRDNGRQISDHRPVFAALLPR